MVEARRFKASDYETMCKWLMGHNMPPVAVELIPQTGFIVDDVAMGFYYKTDSALGMVDFYIGNPEASKEDRAEGLQIVLDNLMKDAKESGIKYMVGYTKYTSLARHAEKNGFKKTGPCFTFIRGL